MAVTAAAEAEADQKKHRFYRIYRIYRKQEGDRKDEQVYIREHSGNDL